MLPVIIIGVIFLQVLRNMPIANKSEVTLFGTRNREINHPYLDSFGF